MTSFHQGLAAMTLTSLSVIASAAGAKPDPCSAPEHRQFDFWVGEWEVMAHGKLAGHNRIEKTAKGCALLESWSGASGFTGQSLNFYDASAGRWHQTWADSSGLSLSLDGQFTEGRMVLAGTRKDPATGAPVTDRITWTPLPSGELRQLWESSPDGKTWSVVFDGFYKRQNHKEK